MPYHLAGRAVSKRSRSVGVQRSMLSHCYYILLQKGVDALLDHKVSSQEDRWWVWAENGEIAGDGNGCTQSPSVPSFPEQGISELQLTLYCWWQRTASGWEVASRMVCCVHGPATLLGFRDASWGPRLVLNQLDAPPCHCCEFASSLSAEVKNPPNIQGEKW